MFSSKQIEVIRALDTGQKEEVLFGGSAGSGKSFLGCFWQINRRIVYPGTRGLIGRAKLKNLRLTTMKTFLTVWTNLFEKEDIGISININQQDNVITFSNGSEIYLKDLFYYPSDPEYTSLGSLEITDAFIDEAGEITRKARDIISSRIRYKLIKNKPALLMSCNPSRNFLKGEFVSDDNGVKVTPAPHRLFVPSTLYDNPDPNFVRTYEKNLLKLSEYDKQRLLYGNWEMTENNAPFFDVYRRKREKIIKSDLPIYEEYPVWISFDFNHSPCTAILGQIIYEKSAINIFDCIQVNGGTEALCKELVRLYDFDTFQTGLKVCGDTSGLNKTSVGGNRNDFDIVRQYLELGPSDIVMPSSRNRKYIYSRTICNYAFEHIENFNIDSEAKALIKDLDIAIVQDDGKLWKDRDKGQGQDAGDAFRYLINAFFPFGVGDIRKFLT
jgi:hypothetical protein